MGALVAPCRVCVASSQVLLEPYWYICQKPGKAVRAHLIAVRDLGWVRGFR